MYYYLSPWSHLSRQLCKGIRLTLDRSRYYYLSDACCKQTIRAVLNDSIKNTYLYDMPIIIPIIKQVLLNLILISRLITFTHANSVKCLKTFCPAFLIYVMRISAKCTEPCSDQALYCSSFYRLTNLYHLSLIQHKSRFTTPERIK